MSNNSKYIITTLSNSIGQRNRPGGNSGSEAGVMPFLFSQPGVINLRGTNLPYISGEKGSLDVLNWETVSSSGDSGGGGGASYIVPFAYYDFETSGSQYVTNVSGTNNYTGSFSSNTDGISNFGFDTSPAYSGSYSLEFPSGYDARDVSLGTINERSNWGTLFSGSFSVSAWMYFNTDSGNAYKLNDYRIFGHGSQGTSRGFHFGIYRGQPMAFSYSPEATTGNPNIARWGDATSANWEGWNHVVFVVEDDTTATNRSYKMYINNTDYGNAEYFGSEIYFQKTFDPSKNAYFGNSWSGTKSTTMNLDEISFWSIALSSGQVDALYNSGNGASALTALTSSE